MQGSWAHAAMRYTIIWKLWHHCRADLLGCTSTAGSACAHLYSVLSIALETFSLPCVQVMYRCVQHKDVLLIHFLYNDFLVQHSFPFPFSLLYLVLSCSEVFLLSSYYSIDVLRAPKWWLFGLGHPWVGHWTKRGETSLSSGQLLTIPQSSSSCILLVTGNSPTLLLLDIVGQDPDRLILIIGGHPISQVVPLASIRLPIQ